jgi:predicted enzyme involved in methoxymalonyl-ACP biosynthesis
MLTELEWLPPAPEDFKDRLRDLARDFDAGRGDGFGERVLALAAHALDDAQLRRLAKLAARLATAPPAGFGRARLGLLGDGTLALHAAPIAASALRHGLVVEVVEGGYGASVQDSQDRSSALHTAALDFALVVGDARLLGLDLAAPSKAAAADKVDAAFQRLTMIVEGLRPSVSSAVLVQTVVPPIDSLFGSFDRVEDGSPFAMVEALNRRIADWAGEGRVILLDIARLAGAVRR